MASRYDELDAYTELEQRLAADLAAALEPRGCRVVHNGARNGGRHAPGGMADIEVHDEPNRRLILVEVTRRRGSAADGEFPAVTDHLNRAVAGGGYDDYGLLYVSPGTSARMSSNFRDLYNRTRERDQVKGRIIGVDFATTELLVDKLVSSDPQLYPASSLGQLLSHWNDAIDDARTRLLVQQVIFPDDLLLANDLANEAQEIDALRERELKGKLEKVENSLRSHGITGNNANTTLVYLAFLRLYEERRQRNTGYPNRFTLDGFRHWCETVPATYRSTHKRHLVEALLSEVAQEPELKEAGLLQQAGTRLHEKLTDDLVESLILPVFDDYDFHAGRVDVLGAVFETLARRSEKDTRVGQFFTPQQVVDFCAELVGLRPVDTVLDPAVGTGRFLIAAMDRMLDNSDTTVQPRHTVEASIRARQLIGADIDEWIATIAKMNMFIHGDGKSGIATRNGLVLGDRPVFANYPDGLRNAVDVVLTNPPLGDTDFTVAGSTWSDLAPDSSNADPAQFYIDLGVIPTRVIEVDRLAELERQRRAIQETIDTLDAMPPDQRKRGQLSRSLRRRDDLAEQAAKLRSVIDASGGSAVPIGKSMKGGALFLGAIAQYLKIERDSSELLEWAGGRAAVVVDEALLNTSDYGPTRTFLRKHFFIKAVISLERDAFRYLAKTDAKTSIVFLVKKPSSQIVQKEPIFFGHADRVGYSATGEWVGDDLPQVLLHYRLFESCVRRHYRGRSFDGQACLAEVKTLTNFGHAFFAALDSGVGARRLDFFDARAEQRRQELVNTFGGIVELEELVRVKEREHPPASRTGEYDFAFVSRLDGTVRPKGPQTVSYRTSELWIVREGDIVVSGIDLVNAAVGVADGSVDGLILSQEMYAYRIRDDVELLPEYLVLMLRTAVGRELLMGLVSGTSKRTRLENPWQLLRLPLPPLPSLEKQEVYVAPLREAHRLQRLAQEELHSAHERAEVAWAQSPRRPKGDPRKLPTAEAELVR